MLQPFTVADCVATNARSFPDRCAIEVLDPRTTGGVEPVETWTYGALWGRAEALADALGPVSACPHGPMAGLLLPNGADHAAAYLACQLVGAAAVPVNNRLAEPEIRYVLEDSGASVLLSAEPFIDIARRVTADLGIALIDAAETPVSAPMRWSRPIGPYADGDRRTGRLVPSTAPTEVTTDERAAMIAYTSGTTGFPKGSINSNAGFLTRLMHWSWTFGLTAREVVSTPGWTAAAGSVAVPAVRRCTRADVLARRGVRHLSECGDHRRLRMDRSRLGDLRHQRPLGARAPLCGRADAGLGGEGG